MKKIIIFCLFLCFSGQLKSQSACFTFVPENGASTINQSLPMQFFTPNDSWMIKILYKNGNWHLISNDSDSLLMYSSEGTLNIFINYFYANNIEYLHKIVADDSNHTYLDSEIEENNTHLFIFVTGHYYSACY